MLHLCFNKCASAREQVRICIKNILDSGFPKEELYKIVNNIATGELFEESNLCAVIVILQVLKYKTKHKKTKSIKIENKKKKKIENNLKKYFKKCDLARKELKKCLINILNQGYTKEEILSFSDGIMGDNDTDESSICAIFAINQVLQYEKNVLD